MPIDVKGYLKMVKEEKKKLGIEPQKKKPIKKEDMPLNKKKEELPEEKEL